MEEILNLIKDKKTTLFVFLTLLLRVATWIHKNKYRDIKTVKGRFITVIAVLAIAPIFYVGWYIETPDVEFIVLAFSLSSFSAALLWHVFTEPTVVYKALLADMDSKGSYVEKYRKLLEIEIQESEFHLEEWEKFIRYKIYLLYHLGDNNAARQCLSMLDNNDVFKKNIESLIIEHEFKYEDSYKILETVKNIHDDSYPKYAADILCNIGRHYRCKGNISEALVFYREAVNIIKPDDLDILDIVYTNYIITLCYDNNNTTAENVDDWIKKYEEIFSDNTVENKVRINNLLVEISRVKGDAESCRHLIDSGFDAILKSDITIEQRLALAASSLRMAHTIGANIIPPLEQLRLYIDEIDNLSMPRKFNVYKEMDFFVKSLIPCNDAVKRTYHVIWDKTKNYMQTQAYSDISSYLDSLPKEAIYERNHYNSQLINLKKYQKEYSMSGCIDELTKIADVYRDNGLLDEEFRIYMDILSEYFFSKNVDPYGMPKDKKGFLKVLDNTAAKLDCNEMSILMADCYLEVAWYYFLVYDYVKAASYYSRFISSKVAILSYIPKLRMQANILEEMVRIQKVYQILKELPSNLELSKGTRNWLRKFPNKNNPYEAYVMLAKLLQIDNMYISKYCWIRKNRQLESHFWLCVGEHIANGPLLINLVVDMFPLGRSEECSKIMFYPPYMHPAEIGKSLYVNDDCFINGDVQRLIYPVEFEEHSRKVMEKLYGEIVNYF